VTFLSVGTQLLFAAGAMNNGAGFGGAAQNGGSKVTFALRRAISALASTNCCSRQRFFLEWSSSLEEALLLLSDSHIRFLRMASGANSSSSEEDEVETGGLGLTFFKFFLILSDLLAVVSVAAWKLFSSKMTVWVAASGGRPYK